MADTEEDIDDAEEWFAEEHDIKRSKREAFALGFRLGADWAERKERRKYGKTLIDRMRKKLKEPKDEE